MDVILLVVLYLAIGLLIAVYTYVGSMRTRPAPFVFSVEDRAVMTLASAIVGLIWILFMPVVIGRAMWLVCIWLARIYRQLRGRSGRLAGNSTESPQTSPTH